MKRILFPCTNRVHISRQKLLLEELEKKFEELPKTDRVTRIFGGVKNITWIDEIPTGAINGVNTTFTVSDSIHERSEILRIGGAVQELTEDYTISGKTITMTVAPATGVRVRIKYQRL